MGGGLSIILERKCGLLELHARRRRRRKREERKKRKEKKIEREGERGWRERRNLPLEVLTPWKTRTLI